MHFLYWYNSGNKILLWTNLWKFDIWNIYPKMVIFFTVRNSVQNKISCYFTHSIVVLGLAKRGAIHTTNQHQGARPSCFWTQANCRYLMRQSSSQFQMWSIGWHGCRWGTTRKPRFGINKMNSTFLLIFVHLSSNCYFFICNFYHFLYTYIMLHLAIISCFKCRL